jgi:hypothetical protein
VLPDAVEVGDLERAYDGICPELVLVGGSEAFTEALRALDDSMLTSYRQDGVFLITGRDPSVRDHLTAYVEQTPAHARAILRGATHWEQVIELGRCLSDLQLRALADELVAGARRLFDARPATFRLVTFTSTFEPPEDVLQRDSLDRSLRLIQLRTLHQRLPDLAALGALRAALLVAHLEQLGAGDIHRSATLELLRAEQTTVLARPDTLAIVRRYFTTGLT